MASPKVKKTMEFSELVLEDEWPDVIQRYRDDRKCHKTTIKGRGTALHVAVNNELKGVVKSLVDEIQNTGDTSSMRIRNDVGATPLHLAAYRGFTDICQLIIGENGERKDLILVENDKGETPLFWAVRAGDRSVFAYLEKFHQQDINIAINNKKTSILHVAIQREMFDLAIMIMHCYPNLSFMNDVDGTVPLQILATRTSAFISGSRLSWWKRILYHCLTISRLDAQTTLESYQEKVISKGNAKNEKDAYIKEELPEYDVEKLEKAYKVRNSLAQSCLKIKKIVFRCLIMSLLDLTTIKNTKKNHIYVDQILEEFMKSPTESYTGGGVDREGYKPEHDYEMEDVFTNTELINVARQRKRESDKKEIMEEHDSKVPTTSDKKGLVLEQKKNIKTDAKRDVKDTAYLIAASNGIVEMMLVLRTKIKSVIDETNSNQENALLLAVKNRQPNVIQFLQKTSKRRGIAYLYLQTDKNENTVLHLAACTSFSEESTWKISGAALKLMWDIKWYQYIKELVPAHYNQRSNKQRKIPSELFKEEHVKLLQDSSEWMKDTAESCSVVAALIAGVSFATSGSVPGGNKQTGEPTLEGHPAFEGFAISSLIGLYFSVTALIMFLSILTSRKEIEDFSRNLPLKLLLGLCSLFVSIVAMFISFCAGHFFVLTDKYTKAGLLFYLYISICLPVAFYAVGQFPLFVDLVKVIWRKVPPPSVKGVLL